MVTDPSARSQRKPNPLVNILPFLVAVYGWQLHGWMIGLGLGILYFGTVMVLNNLYLFRFDSEDSGLDDMIRSFQRIKWITFLVFMVAMSVPMIRIGMNDG
jgi:hypothetical protein